MQNTTSGIAERLVKNYKEATREDGIARKSVAATGEMMERAVEAVFEFAQTCYERSKALATACFGGSWDDDI
jgi:NAD(P)H-hydrate repair Nnr-like enzyme with NAD(P)H-hydrate epimerase domain